MDDVSRVQSMLSRLDEIDKLFSRQEQERDLHEKLSAHAVQEAAEAAKVARALFQKIMTFVALCLFAWTPIVSYGAIWFHEKVRNNCYPAVALVEDGPVDEGWFCGIFPGTDQPDHHQ